MSRGLHPIVEQMAPSGEQGPPIVARGSDVVVTAGAGTGKTRTLVARYLSLLADGVGLRAVVAITFTRKAAREMRNRVRAEVRRYLETGDLSGNERLRWRAVYERLDAARIGTIHNLCAEILRHHPAETGLDPRFDMLEEGQMALLRAQAVDAALAWAADDPDTVRLFADFGEHGLRRAVASLLEKRLDVSETRERLAADLWRAWQPHLVAPMRAFVDHATVQADFAALDALRANGTIEQAESAGDVLAPYLRTALRQWKTIDAARQEGDWVTISRHLAPLRGALKQKGRRSNWAPAAPKAVIAELQGIYDERLKPLVGSGIDLALDRHLARDVVPALLQLYDRALAQYNQAKRERRALDFDDLEAKAVWLLREHSDVRAYWQDQIQALLVDEFQDTNGRQRDLLDLLNGDAGRLFIVGDGKQSIYRFRGADVTVFRREREAIRARGAGFELETSYRAHRDLIEALNAILRPLLGERDDPERPYVEPFAAIRPRREEPAAGLAPPYIELHLAVGSKSGGALDRAARAMAERLVALVECDKIILQGLDAEQENTPPRPLDYGDVAILCRASSAFPAYENALEEAGIPFLTIAGRGFYDRPEVRDLLNTLQALAQPSDDLALAGLLRSPAMGLSDMALYRLRRAQRRRDLTSLWGLLSRDDLSFLGEEADRAAEAQALIGRLHGMVGRVPVADVLKAFLDGTGYRAALLRAGQGRAANNVAKLLAEAHASGIVSVGTFVATMSELRDVAPREGEARAIAAGAVQIMSVHQAKGLEFPVVCIGDAARRAPRRGGMLIDAELGVVPPLGDESLITTAEGAREVQKVSSAAYRLAQGQDQDEEAAESDRLLYVAATRAQEMLLVSGTVSAHKSGGIGTTGWLDRLDDGLGLSDQAPPCDGEGAAVHRFTLDIGRQSAHCAIYEPAADLEPAAAAEQIEPVLTLPSDLALLAPVGADRLQVDEALRDADRDPPRRVWRVAPRTDRPSAPSWVVGKLVHLALEHWYLPGDEGMDFHVWAAAQVRGWGLTDEAAVRDAARRAARMLTRFRASPLHAEMTAAERRLHEVPYSSPSDDGTVEIGAIDALFRSDGRWVVVEFKTDQVEGRADLERTLEKKDYVHQVARYVSAVEQLLGERPRAVLCFLNCAGRVRL
ncbi:MAG: UvrD-helicase domain-containing protein, partial [Anaerolineae bacterium]